MPFTGPPLNSIIRPTEILRFGLQTKPDEPALVSADRRWAWRKLKSRVIRRVVEGERAVRWGL